MQENIYSIQSHETSDDALHFELAGISYCDGSYRIWRPRSTVACIEFVLEGRGTIEIDGQTHRPGAGDCYFLQMGKDQLYFADEVDPWVKIWVNVSGRLLDDLVAAYGLRACYYFPDFPAGDLLEQIYLNARDRRPDSHLRCTLLLHELLYKMATVVYDGRQVNPLAAQMKDYLETQVKGQVSVKDLGRLVAKSESQVIRIFRESYGQTPYAYFLDLKINLAKRLLKGSNMSIQAISEELSFADEFYFSNVFKKHTAMAPQHYRKRL